MIEKSYQFSWKQLAQVASVETMSGNLKTPARPKTPHLYAGVTSPKLPKSPLHAYASPPQTPRVRGTHLQPDNTAWLHFAQTFLSDWGNGGKSAKVTEKWVEEQRTVKAESRAKKIEKENWQSWEELASDVDAQAQRWMRQEETRRRIAAAKEADRVRRVQEEMRRIQERIDRKVEADILRLGEEKKRREEQRRRAERDHALECWREYETGWSVVASSTEPLTFDSIPWPMFLAVRSPLDLNLKEISDFLLSPYHSPTLSKKERLRGAIRLYHPDRFRRLLPKVDPNHRVLIEQGVGIVARCINDLMSRE